MNIAILTVVGERIEELRQVGYEVDQELFLEFALELADDIMIGFDPSVYGYLERGTDPSNPQARSFIADLSDTLETQPVRWAKWLREIESAKPEGHGIRSKRALRRFDRAIGGFVNIYPGQSQLR